MVKAIVGANWGDEGKGKITDMLAEHSDIVVRFQGGANAGHTIINDYGRFSLHILPSGSFYSHVTNVIGNGVALDLKKLVDELTRRQADYDELKNQNDLYRRFFSISDSNADYTLEPATVIAHVPDDPSGSFIINIGQSQGITSGMPVITENGLVGIVGRVSERYCRVLTLMDPAVNIGVLDSTTLDTGILTGDAAMSEDNTARLTYLRLQSEAAAGDLILTSGYGEQIPQGLTVGYLSEVSLAATGLTLEGVIDLSARPENARQVFVITDFTVTLTPSEEVPPEETNP